MCDFMDEIDKNWKCKFSRESLFMDGTGSHFICVAISGKMKCNGTVNDRFSCPYWCQVYHANKVIQ
jgi:hypothetical protein